jgi:exopolysaccharide biosynthesis polyprenyl glycosylphosphotransferase
MSPFSKKDPFLLFAGDIVLFLVSLWLTLFVRYGELPSPSLFYTHLAPFSILFIVWYIVFFIAGLYEKHTIVLRTKLPSIIFRAQLINSLIAVLFFYFIPYFGITPKTILFIYLLISFSTIVFWRIYSYSILGRKRKQNALLIASGDEMKELRDEVNSNQGYNLRFLSSVDLDKIESIDFQNEVLQQVYSEEVSIIAVDFRNEKVEPILPQLYNLIFSKIIFIDMHKIYEDTFNRIPLSLVKYSWFLENISLSPKFTYDLLKRIMDIAIAFPLAIISLPFYALAMILIKLDDGGSIFFVQDRVGKNNKIIKNIKFRTMTVHGESDGLSKNPTITRVGRFLRKSRIDELPQLLNVIRGDISLIGPRPEIPVLVKLYEREIPYYNIRHLIKPGLSGWAQLYQKDPPKNSANADKTRIKLSYDLYYIKNRSFLLDIKIALKTIKTLLSRSGV